VKQSSKRKAPKVQPKAIMSLSKGPKLRVEDVLHECIRRSISRHGPTKRWKPFPWVTKLVSKFDDFFDTDEKLADPSADTDMSMAGSLVSLNTVYKFRLVHAPGGISSNGSGVMAGFHSADPSGGSGSTWTSVEWASLVALFSEVKLGRFSIHFSPYVQNTQLLKGRLLISGVLSSVAAAPATKDNVWDNADAKVYNLGVETSLHGYVHTIRGSDLNWAVVTTPNPGSYAGVPGSIQWFGDGYTISLGFADTDLEGIYKFRSRI